MPNTTESVAPGENPGQTADYDISSPRVDKDGNVTWDKVKLGRYVQDIEIKEQPIKWRILSLNGDCAFVMADEVIDCLPYNDVATGTNSEKENDYSDYSCTWETSSIRKWLNNDFYDTAFSNTEKSAIKNTKVITEDNLKWDNESGRELVDGGNDTEDNIFLISILELLNPHRYLPFYE